MIIFTFTLTCFIIPFFMNYTNYLKFNSIKLQSNDIWFALFLASFLFVIMLHALIFMSFVSFGTSIFQNKTLQLSVHLSKLTMNR